MKRIIYAIIGIIVFYLFLATGLHYVFEYHIWPFSVFEARKESLFIEDAKYLTKDYPTEIVVFGDEIENVGKLPIRQIASLDNITQQSKDELYYKAIFIFDRDDKLELSNDDFEKIDGYLQEGWNIYYVGEQYVSTLEMKYFNSDSSRTDNVSIAICKRYDGSLTYSTGFWRPSYETSHSVFDLNALIIAIKSDIREKIRIENVIKEK